MSQAPLKGLRVIEVAMLGAAAVTTPLADLGADVIKVEPPNGDYIREMTWPIIEGTSLMHYHLNRGKKSITLDLKSTQGKAYYRALVKDADVVVEAMRPGTMSKLGLGYEDVRQLNSPLVYCNVTGYGATGPYQSMPSHGVAFDTWAGAITPAYDEEGYCYIPEHVSMGINAAPYIGGVAVLAGVLRARETGKGCLMEFGQNEAAAFFDWYRSESYMAYERPESEVTGNKADNFQRRPVGTKGMKEGVRYQIYETQDGHVLFMASEQAFWKNFCIGVERQDLFEQWPGARYGDHATGNRELQSSLQSIFKQRTSQQWIKFGSEFNTPLAPVNTPQNIVDDPQFKQRLTILPHEKHGADMLAFPVKFVGEELSAPAKAPEAGQHTQQILASLELAC